MEIKTKNGLVYTFDEEMLGDFEIFENLVEIEKGNPKLLPDTIKALLGEKGYTQLKESCRNDKGRTPTADVVDAFGEILALAGSKGDKKK